LKAMTGKQNLSQKDKPANSLSLNFERHTAKEGIWSRGPSLSSARFASWLE
jgi:hypothetical protein